MKDGSIVVGLFIAAILIMLGMFINRVVDENDRMKELLLEQEEIIELQNAAIQRYSIMYLFNYHGELNTKPKKDSPIH